MTCTTCGRDNPPHLTFCQECGQRLGPRIAPPTPPIGLGGQDAYGPPPNLPPRVATALGMAERPAAQKAAAPTAGGDRRCKVCDTINGPSLRYCTSCGSTLDPAPAAGPAPAAAPAPPPAPVASAIAPSRVVDLGTAGTAAAEAFRTCSRCRGTADGSAQFCKFCGASLENAAPALPPPTEEARIPRAPTAAMGGVVPARSVAPAPPAPSLSPAASASPHRGANHSPQPPAGGGAAALAAVVAGAGSAAAPGAVVRGRLVVIAKSGADGPNYAFADLLDIGRTEGNVVVGEDPYLSPRHVRIVWHGGKMLLRDLGSTNGVFLRLAPSRDTSPRRSTDNPEVAVPLADHDVILVGQQVLRFDILKEGEGGFGPAQEHGTLLFGSPAAPRYARLCQRTVEGISRDVYYVRKVETVLGRESGDVVFTEDPFLSRRHAAIRLLSRDGSPGGSKPPPGDARFALVNLGSSNGTFLRIRGDVELAPGDHFRVGQQLFRIDFEHGARG